MGNMSCIYCGKTADGLMCHECRTIDKLDEVFFEMLFFKGEYCALENVRSFVESFESPVDAKQQLPELLALFDDQDVSYYWCRYYRTMRDDRFEETAVAYLAQHEEWNMHRQRVLYDLLSFYLRNDFIKPTKWCETIRNTVGLCAELYETAAQFLAMVGDYDDAQQIVELALQSDQFIFSNAENMRVSIDKLRVDIERYRTRKPYWPTTEERRRKLAGIYDEKGIKYPRITSKPTKVPENEFEPIEEYVDELPSDYCAFWCSAVFGVTAAKCIYQIAAVRIRDGEAVDHFQSFVRPWDSSIGRKSAAKEVGVDVEVLQAADDVDLVLPRFFEFVGNDVLVSTDALGNQAKLISRAARYSGMKRINNEFCDLLDAAADVSSEFDMANNNREYLLGYFKIAEGTDALSKAIANVELCRKLAECDG